MTPLFLHTAWNRSLCLVAISLMALVSLGCQDAVKAPFSPRPDPVAGNYPQVVLMNDLQRALVIDQPVVAPSTADKPMRVTVAVRSVEDEYPVHVQYRFEFMDDQGRPLQQANTGWRYMRLDPRVPTYLNGNATHLAAADWRLLIRSAR